MVRRPVVLASASAARLRLLRDAGFDPEVMVSGVDESAVDAADAWDLVQQLASAKARTVAARCTHGDALVIGCDSMLLLDGEALGKAADAAEVAARWRRMRGRTGVLLTGHCVVDVGSGRDVQQVADTVVRFGQPSDEEIAAYAGTDEALAVAGPFTIDGRAAAFVESIEGDAGNVIGISLPLLRQMFAKLDVEMVSLWS
jgi:septum formation protein